MMKSSTFLLVLSATAVLACSGGSSAEPSFPEDYLSTYQEVRDCRLSSDHDLNHIRVLADPAALGPYRDRDADFPTGAIVLKEEYDFTDDTCSGELIQWTVMRRLEAGSSPRTLDWSWERVEPDRTVDEGLDQARCAGCHATCEPPDGYESTCAVP